MKKSITPLIMVCLLVLSIGFNIALTQKVIKLTGNINKTQTYVSDNELYNIQKEIKILSSDDNIQYDIKTKQQIINKF